MCKRRAVYSDRPLTAEEKVFAEENHYVLFKFMSSYKLNYSEWYDILIIPYLNSVKKYHTFIELQKWDFGAIAYKTLGSAFTNYVKAENRMCRKPEGGFVYLNFASEEDDSFPEDKLNCWIDTKQQVEEQILDKETLVLILNNLDEVQQRIFTMLLEGYQKYLIKEALCITQTILMKQLEYIQKVTYTVLYR